MTCEKLNECSAATHGIYIKGIMCLMHKSERYGTLLLKQKYKQTGKPSRDFACQLVKNLPYKEVEIEEAIDELIEEKVCFWEDDYLCQARMIYDNDISVKRSNAGRRGVTKTGEKFAEATVEAKPDYENDDVNSIVINKDNISELTGCYTMKENVCKLTRKSLQEIDSLLSFFIIEQQAKGDLNRPLGDLRRHFTSWAKVNADQFIKVGYKAKQFTELPKIDAKAEHQKFLAAAKEKGIKLAYVKQ